MRMLSPVTLFQSGGLYWPVAMAGIGAIDCTAPPSSEMPNVCGAGSALNDGYRYVLTVYCVALPVLLLNV